MNNKLMNDEKIIVLINIFCKEKNGLFKFFRLDLDPNQNEVDPKQC